jgi:selenocysteine lyase/cysteine desulfurase
VRPIDVQKLQPDALICAGYKWLFGSYGLGVAWFGPAFDHGNPIEQGWMAREQSEDFKNLIDYQDEYRGKARRYSMGESSQFILLPMLSRAIQQINDWGPANILSHCDAITTKAFDELQALDCKVEPRASRSPHLFGVHLGDSMNPEVLQQLLNEEQIYVSLRGPAVRVSPHVYNTEEDTLRIDA